MSKLSTKEAIKALNKRLDNPVRQRKLLFTDLRDDLHSLRSRVGQLESAIAVQTVAYNNRINRLRDKVEQLAVVSVKPKVVVDEDEWKTRAGEILKIRDMGTEHIVNCLYGGFVPSESPKATVMVKELQRRAKKASEAYGVSPKPLNLFPGLTGPWRV